jgi:hypothetical protein
MSSPFSGNSLAVVYLNDNDNDDGDDDNGMGEKDDAIDQAEGDETWGQGGSQVVAEKEEEVPAPLPG